MKSLFVSPARLGCGSILLLAVTALVSCQQSPSDLREWRPTDHDHTDNPGNNQVQVDPSKQAEKPVAGLEDVTIVAWQQNCVSCHGTLGRGDGPRGAMLKAADLSNPAFQAATTDEAIARTIREGRGAMPPFKLPENTIKSLVRLVRMMNADRANGPATAPGPSGG